MSPLFSHSCGLTQHLAHGSCLTRITCYLLWNHRKWAVTWLPVKTTLALEATAKTQNHGGWGWGRAHAPQSS